MVIGCLGVERRAERFLSYLAIFVVFQATTKKMEEWPKSAPLFFSATLLFFGVCKWNFPSRMKSIVFIFSATQSDCCKKQTAHERRTSRCSTAACGVRGRPGLACSVPERRDLSCWIAQRALFCGAHGAPRPASPFAVKTQPPPSPLTWPLCRPLEVALPRVR